MSKISNNNESLVKYFIELFTADDSLYIESEKAYISSGHKKDNILIKVQGFRGANFSLCEFTVKVETTNNKNIVSFIFKILAENSLLFKGEMKGVIYANALTKIYF